MRARACCAPPIPGRTPDGGACSRARPPAYPRRAARRPGILPLTQGQKALPGAALLPARPGTVHNRGDVSIGAVVRATETIKRFAVGHFARCTGRRSRFMRTQTCQRHRQPSRRARPVAQPTSSLSGGHGTGPSQTKRSGHIRDPGQGAPSIPLRVTARGGGAQQLRSTAATPTSDPGLRRGLSFRGAAATQAALDR